MSTGSNIEWTEATWTPVKGCTRVSEGCDHCYAVGMTHRLEAMGQQKYAGLTVLNGRGERHFNGKVVLDADALAVPLHWKKPRTIFVSSMSDIFHKDVPFEYLDRIFAVMALCPQHTFQVLTKRPERMAEYTADAGRLSMVAQAGAMMGHGEATMRFAWPLPNVWLGTSVEDQKAADERIPHLLKCPAAVRFLSCEPLLGPVDLSAFFGGPYVGLPGDVVHQNWNAGIDWVIVGGESGPKARPCDVAWIRSVVQQCKAAGVPCFVKQLGSVPRIHTEYERVTFPGDPRMLEKDGMYLLALRDRKGGDMAEWPDDLRVREMPASSSPEANS